MSRVQKNISTWFMKIRRFGHCRTLCISTIAIIVLLASFSGCKMGKKKEEPSQQPKPKAVEVITPRKGSIQPAISFTGTMVPVNEVDIYSKLPGRVKDVMVKEGDEVTEGQLLIQLEDEELNAQVRQLEANLVSARVQLSKAETGYSLQDTQVDVGIEQSEQGKAQAKFNSDQAQYNLEDARIDWNRMQKLFERGAVSREQLENAELRYNTAKKQYETSLSLVKQADESLKLARANTAMKSIKKDDIALAQAQIDSLEASLEITRTNLNNCRIVAPFTGVITLKTVDKGEVVIAMPTGIPLLKLVDNSTVNLEGDIGEDRIHEVKQGGIVELTIDAIPGKTFRGLVATAIPQVDLKTKAFRIKVAVPNQTGEIKGGMFARGKILLTPCIGLVIPRHCLIQGGDTESVKIVEDKKNPEKGPSLLSDRENFYVFVQEQNKAKKVPVTVGEFNEKEAVIIKGISKESKVISVGQETLMDGDLITVARGK